MLSVATAAVHRNIRPKATTTSPTSPNIMVDTSCTWNARITQSAKRRRNHQGPCSARKKLIPSPTEDLSLNLNLNSSEITLTPIKKTIGNTGIADRNNYHQTPSDITHKNDSNKTNDATSMRKCNDVYLIVEVHDNTAPTTKNGAVKSDHTESKNCSLMPFVNSDEISIRPIVKKPIHRKIQKDDGTILRSELTIIKPSSGATSEPVSMNVLNTAEIQVQSKSTSPKTPVSKATKCTNPASISTVEANSSFGNALITTESFYKKSAAQRSTATTPLSLSKKNPNQSKSNSSIGIKSKIARAVENLKNSSENSINIFSLNTNDQPKSKTSKHIVNSTPKVAVIINPVVPNLQEICTAHNNFDASAIPEEMFNPWNGDDLEESGSTSLGSIKRLEILKVPDDRLLTETNLQEPYHLTGFPNPPGENRCWLNATLQALFAMPLLDTFHHYNLQDCSKLTKYLITTKVHWMKGTSGREKAYQTIKLLKEELGVLDETYPSERQQDVSEFLMILLNHIKSDLGKLISAEEGVNEMENVPKNQQDSHKVLKTPQTPNKRQPLADISIPQNNGMKRSHSLGDPNQSPKLKKLGLSHNNNDLLSPKLRKLSNPSDPSYKVHTPPLAPTNDETMLHKNPVDENFQLHLMEHYTCKGCQKHRQKKVDNLMLFVDIPSDDIMAPIDLQRAVENIFAPEERHLTCGTCKHDVHIMRTTFRRQPNILTLQVNRYGMSSEGIFSKISTDVTIPKNLDLGATFLNDAPKNSTAYEPICIIAHAGGTMDCGHYTSYVRHGNQWYHYNDMDVAPMTEEEALSAAQMTAYLVFFVKSAEQDSDEV
ncbi:uncharacterized protein LOC107226812 [Neodiprion lecontei]|uniref:Uncharacterized protein LOC107226812 n=1 Tax=Neodiprion lecontei TaxID=441921 RepID=A0A6J0C7A8_NEOLC|nr:uncharacterized protein LOC107226812 [Neodiprion lecontei]